MESKNDDLTPKQKEALVELRKLSSEIADFIESGANYVQLVMKLQQENLVPADEKYKRIILFAGDYWGIKITEVTDSPRDES